MSTSVSFASLILNASLIVQLVMLLLFLASIYGWYLIVQLELNHRKSRQADEQFEKGFWAGSDLKQLYQTAQSNPARAGLEAIFYDGFSEFMKFRQKNHSVAASIAGTERLLRVALNREQHTLEQGTPTLASIGSVSPYVGLFGTVFGIMNAFMGLSSAKQATLASVAPGIAEALIATAIGLFAAIPAVLAFNRYHSLAEARFQQRMLFAEELTGLLERESPPEKPTPSAPAASVR
jgi:biopolymer transport protein TolQ